jgi:putative Mg2+ transporter-C (MgtC) family protein
VALGGVIGYERERSGHTAGLRTHLIVTLASATFMLVSTQCVYFQGYGPNDLARVDGSRIAAGVVMGIGFLGGGAILHSGLSVQGLTTAASLWLVAAVGLAAGGGLFLTATAATGATLACLALLRQVEEKQGHRPRRRVEVVLDGAADRCRAVFDLLRRSGAVVVEDVSLERLVKGGRSRVCLNAQFRDEEALDEALRGLEALPWVRRLKIQRLG